MRYVHYFENVYKRIVKSPIIKIPEKIVIYNAPDIAGNSKIKPYIEIVNGTDFSLIWTNKKCMNLPTFKIKDGKIE